MVGGKLGSELGSELEQRSLPRPDPRGLLARVPCARPTQALAAYHMCVFLYGEAFPKL